MKEKFKTVLAFICVCLLIVFTNITPVTATSLKPANHDLPVVVEY